MSNTGRWMIAICLAVLLILMLSACAAPKAAIPDDLVLTCYEGQYAIYSKKAQEARILPIACKDGKDI